MLTSSDRHLVETIASFGVLITNEQGARNQSKAKMYDLDNPGANKQQAVKIFVKRAGKRAWEEMVNLSSVFFL